MNTSSAKPVWTFRRKVLLRAPDSPAFEASLPAALFISHDIDNNKGIISAQVDLDPSNPARPPQVLRLMFLPESVKACSWIQRSDDHLCPPRVLSKVPRHGVVASSVSTLSFELHTTATLFLPLDLKPLSPQSHETLDLNALEKISGSHMLYIHFGKDQVNGRDRQLLQRFLTALREDNIEELSLDTKRQGLTQGNLNTLRQVAVPPPYTAKPVSEQEEPVELPPYGAVATPGHVAEKHPNAPSSILQGDEKLKRPLCLSSPPPGSPTEVNTPSTGPLSPPSWASIYPTIFQRITSPDCEKPMLLDLEHQLRGLPDDTIRNLLTRSGHGHLLVKPAAADSRPSTASEKTTFSQSGMHDCESIQQYVNVAVEQRLQSHVDEIVNRNSDLLHGLLKEKGQDFREQIDNVEYDLRHKTEDWMDEFQDAYLDYMKQLDAKSQDCLDTINDQAVVSKGEKIARFRRNLLRRHRAYQLGSNLYMPKSRRPTNPKRRLRS